MEIDVLEKPLENLLQFKKSEAKPLEIKKQESEPKHCQHPQFDLHEYNRLVECRECGKMLDAFDALMLIANGFVRLDYRLDEFRDYHDKINGNRFDEKFKEEASWIKVRPKDSAAASAWDLFAIYYGTQEIKIKKQRGAAGGWCGSKVKLNGWASIEYVKSQLVSSGALKLSIVADTPTPALGGV